MTRALLPIRDESDVVAARQKAREAGAREGLAPHASEELAIATSEIARNALVHGGGGDVIIEPCVANGRRGVVVVARDEGPGIADMDQAMRDGYSTGAGLGLGLPSAKRLVDAFTIESKQGEGTTVTLTKWVPEGRAR